MFMLGGLLLTSAATPANADVVMYVFLFHASALAFVATDVKANPLSKHM